ncbi:hypothetical protein N2152v2_009936 [Parachlorella kessleri]
MQRASWLLVAALLTAQLHLSSAAAASVRVPDFMSAYISSRAAQVVKQRANLAADLDAAAKAAAAMAAAPRYRPPKVKPPVGKPNYVDLTRVGLRPQALNGGVNFDPTGRYPRGPAAQLPPRPSPITTCPEPSSVRSFGAKGDGFADDAGAILSANAAPQLAFIYFPPGNYRVGSSITVTKPILAGAGALLSVAAGATLTFTQRITKYDANGALFAGPGVVKLAGSSDEVRHTWFKNVDQGETDVDALQQAVNSCSGTCTLLLNGPVFLTRQVALKPPCGVFSSTAATVVGNVAGSRGEGFVLTPGKFKRPVLLSTMWGFSSFGVKIQGGVSGAEIQVQGLLQASEGVSFAVREGSVRNITNVYVTHMTFANSVQNTVVYRAGASTDLINNCLVRGNFVVSPGFSNPSAASAALAVRGAATPTLVGTSVEIQAVDATQAQTITQFAMVRNEVAAPAKDVVFRLTAWGGGLVAGAGKLASGQFSNLKHLARMSGGVPDASFMSTLSGPSNYMTMWEVASAGWELPVPSTPNRAAFNGGATVTAQVHYLSAAITGTWNPGESRTFYLYNAFARSAGSRIKCLPFRAGNSGLVCSRIENQSGTAADQIAVTLLNTAGYALPSWQPSQRFGIQVGP